MCGIAGKVWLDVRRPADMAGIKVMTDIQVHRGPDDEGHFGHGPVALGHRRLSILDLSPSGHQPMVSADGQFVIVFNGEIYNFVELRAELEQLGSTFRSHSDTEVILEAYKHWGEACVTHFNGMWAFALYDLQEKSIFLSRDRFGIKPFYYTLRDGCFAFSSEIKGILACWPELRRANLAAIQHFIPSGALDDGPETFFHDVFSLPAAHSARYDVAKGTLRTFRYWDLDVEAFRARWQGADPVETLAELLESAIGLHMRADVPVGTCLSGGVDSSTIVGLMSKRHPQPIHTFSGLYGDKDCDEKEYVDAVNGHVPTVPCHVFPEPTNNLMDDLMRITWHQDEPTAGPGLYTQYHVMRAASKHVKVILDGQGGDELFAGYLPYLGLRLNDLLDQGGLRNYLQVLAVTAQIVRHWGIKWAPAARLMGQAIPRIWRRLTGLKSRLLGGSTAAIANSPLMHPSLTERVEGRTIVRNRPKRFASLLQDRLYWHLVDESIPALLHYEDRNSMAYAIEARVPLLDYRIVEFALSLSAEHKIRGSWTKWVLRRVAERVVPAKVAWRRSKMGYPTPFSRWLRHPAHIAAIHDILFSSSFRQRELVPEETLRALWQQHQSQRADNSWILYRCLTMEMWHQMYLDAWVPQPACNFPTTPTLAGRAAA